MNSRTTASSNGTIEIRLRCLGGLGMSRCRFTRHINSKQFSRCPFKGHCLIVQQRDGRNVTSHSRRMCFFNFYQGVYI